MLQREGKTLNPYKKLLGNSALFAIGNMGSKIVSILLVPLYTYQLSTTEFGTVDLVTTTSRMLLPLVSLSIFDAVLRFVMDKQNDTQSVITNGIAVTLMGALISFLAYPLLKGFNLMDGLLLYMLVILVLQSFQSLLSQFCRAIDKIRAFALNGIIQTFTMGVTNIYLLVYLDLGIDGYLLSIVISNIASILYLAFSVRLHQYIKIEKLNKPLIKNMLIYSIPLIPNAFMWWLMNASNRFFVFYFVGAAGNGIFAVANKIPSLLTIFTTIFTQAWQLSAIEEFDSEGKSSLYSNVFTYYSMFMFIGASGILMVLKIATGILVAPDYYVSWQVVPPLLLGVVFSSFSGFLGTNYVAAKQTKGVFSSSVIGGVASVILNLLLIPLLGVSGAGISTMLSFMAIWLIRVYDTRKFVSMKINWKNIIGNLFILSLQTVILFLELNIWVELGIELGLFASLLFHNRELFKPMLALIKKRK